MKKTNNKITNHYSKSKKRNNDKKGREKNILRPNLLFNPISGTVKIQRNGHAYLIIDKEQIGKEESITINTNQELFIHKNNLNTAMNGDSVICNIGINKNEKGDELQGIVSKVVERKTTSFSGVINIDSVNGYGFVRTAGKNGVNVDIFVPKENLNGSLDNDVVVVSFEKWNLNDKSPTGLVREVLGQKGVHETEMKYILNENNICYNFPEEVEVEANSIPVEIPEEEIKKRTDMRNTFSFSIDGEDAKDLDDVLSFSILNNGNYEIGVHIADVSHYIKKGCAIDKEAFERGTSIYLVDRCIPMLPERLSNGVCSLHPGDDKLCFSVLFEIDKENFKILNHKFKKTIIHSNKRFSYKEVQKIIEENKNFKSINNFDQENCEDINNSILQINEIAKKLRNERLSHGAINFSRKEVKVELDELNKPANITWYENKESNQLIEELMLLANTTVSTFLYKNEIPAAFRNHDLPNQEKLLELSNFVKSFNYEFEVNDNHKKNKQNLNKLLLTIKGNPEESIISTLAIRSMSKAECNVLNIGHYGLGEKFMPPNAYGWFTSPIRRYADLCNHRQLFDFLSKTGKI
jgi:ribonuclease R